MESKNNAVIPFQTLMQDLRLNLKIEEIIDRLESQASNNMF